MDTTHLNFQFILYLYLVSLSLIHSSEAFFRLLCHGQLGIMRVDPLMAPGGASQHCHNIQGASNFGVDVDYDTLLASNCTSCSVRQDKSAYWSPQLFFSHDNGKYEAVPTQGGLTVYYFVESPMAQGQPVELVAFPKGFRMIAGNAAKRKFFGPLPKPPMAEWKDSDRSQQSLMEKSIGFNCLASTDGVQEGALERNQWPDRAKLDTCAEGIRVELQFPSCWNGDLDSENHTSHVAYPYLLRDGDCPDGFNTRLPTLLYETIYDTYKFKGTPGQFVFAQGDHSGTGYHGDFVNGWEEGVLDQAIATCSGGAGTGLQEDCKALDIKPDSEVIGCEMETPEILQHEEVTLVDQLPGGCKVVADVDFSEDCGAEGSVPAAPPAPAPNSPPTPGPTGTPADSNIAMSTPANSQVTDDTTPTALSPSTTITPSASPANGNEVSTFTSVTTVNGTVLNYVVIEEIIMTTVTVEGGPNPTPGATPSLAAKRHIHLHTAETHYNSKVHSHGGKNGKKVCKAFW